jgi:steroid delta-isomerase-like uncharacterized protein
VSKSAEDVARAWVGFINAGDFAGLRSVYAEDIRAALPSQQRGIEGADAMVEAVREWAGAFSDLHGTLNAVHADGETATIEVTFTGIWSGPLNMPGVVLQTPTNRQMISSVCEVMEIEDGKIRVARPYYDMLTILQQIGAIDN